MSKIQKKLFELQDVEYRDFHSSLIPNVPKENIIGVRIPKLRALAKELFREGDWQDFLITVPHKYYEENNLHAFIIEQISDFNECLYQTEKFLPYVDNWVTCDSLRPKALKKDPQKLLDKIHLWLSSDKPYTVRFGIEMLMCYFLDEEFKPDYAELVSRVRLDDYYVDMMIAWYFATALAKQYEVILPHIEKAVLPPKIHNKAIQKAIESFRITNEQKVYLKTFKTKKL